MFCSAFANRRYRPPLRFLDFFVSPFEISLSQSPKNHARVSEYILGIVGSSR